MKKRILGIIFALMLAATMLPAGVVTADVADGNLIVNGSFEIAAEEGSEEASQTGAKGWFILNGDLGERTVPEGDGAVAPIAGDAYFTVQVATSGKNQYLYQTLTLEAGKKYTVSFLVKITDAPHLAAGLTFDATTPAAHTVDVLSNVGAGQTTDWRRISKTFTVPGTEGEMVDTVFSVYAYQASASATPTAYIDNVRLVEDKNQGTVLYHVDGFETFDFESYSGANKFVSPTIPFSGSWKTYYESDPASGTVRSNTVLGGETTKFVLHEDGNTVLRFSSDDRGVSYINFNVTSIDFAGKGVSKGTPLRFSFKARLVDIPDDLNTSTTPTFSPYVMQGQTKENAAYEEFEVGTGGKNEPDILKEDGTPVTDGTTVYLRYSDYYTYTMFPLELSTANVNETNKNANDWVQFDFIFPYQDMMKTITLSSGYTGARFTGTLPAGYSWEIDDLELVTTNSILLPGGGTVAPEHSVGLLDTSSNNVKTAAQKADGSGEQYTLASGWRRVLPDAFEFPYCKTMLDAAKKVKPYSKTATTAGAAYIKADEATGASVVTSVYKMNGSIRTLVGFEVTEVEDGGFVAIPEIALADIVDEAGTYEVKSYIWSVNTIIPISERVITRVAE